LQPLIRLIVTVAAIANEIDHHVLAELHAYKSARRATNTTGLGIIRVHMENRRLEHLATSLE